MLDVDKVIKGLNICLQQFNSLSCGEDCPYYPIDGRGCIDKLREDTIAFLKDNGKASKAVKDAVWSLIEK